MPKKKTSETSRRDHHILRAVVFINPDVPFALGSDSKRRQLLQHRIQRCESRGNTAGLFRTWEENSESTNTNINVS